jgi:Tfp pilus assembly protein PilO
MSLTDKQKKIGIGILIIGYLYFFYTYNWNHSIPGIQNNRQKITEMKEKVAKLEHELSNIEQSKRELDSLKTASLRYSDYIAQDIELVGALDYMEKLSSFFPGEIIAVSFTPPRENARFEPSFYELELNLRVALTYADLEALVDFVEGNTRIAKIKNIRITPDPLPVEQRESAGNRLPSIYQNGWRLQASIGLTMYALDKDSAEKFYEMGRNKFERFGYFDGIAYADSSMPLGGRVVNINFNQAGGGALPPATSRRDILIGMDSFLSGMDNFYVRGIDTSQNRESIRYRTKAYQNITLRLNNYTYSVDVYDAEGNTQSFLGSFPRRDVIVYLRDTVPDISENQDLGMTIKVINESDYNVGMQFSRKKR